MTAYRDDCAPRVIIIADDLTGACDSAAPYAALGMRAAVALYAADIGPDGPAPATAADVLAFDTDSRDRDTGSAMPAIAVAAHAASRMDRALPFVKIDSTLRGRPGDILAEIRGQISGRQCVICPAFPAQGRTVVQGSVIVRGVPLAVSEFARAGRTSSVAEALGLSGRAWVHISLDIVRVGVEAIERALTAAPGAAAVCDAETDADLDHIAKVVRRSPGRSLPLGSAGLSAALARQMPSRTSPERDWPEANAPADGRLAVIGSRHAAARKQAAALAAHVGMARVLADSPDPVTRCLSALECGVALLVSPDRDGDAEEIASALARTTRMVLETRSSAGRAWPSLLLTGGDAARHLLVSLGCHGIALTGEAQPGMARGVLLGGPYAGLSVVTKAGGFGDEDALIRWCGRL